MPDMAGDGCARETGLQFALTMSSTGKRPRICEEGVEGRVEVAPTRGVAGARVGPAATGILDSSAVSGLVARRTALEAPALWNPRTVVMAGAAGAIIVLAAVCTMRFFVGSLWLLATPLPGAWSSASGQGGWDWAYSAGANPVRRREDLLQRKKESWRGQDDDAGIWRGGTTATMLSDW
jgi:hypothetical protein